MNRYGPHYKQIVWCALSPVGEPVASALHAIKWPQSMRLLGSSRKVAKGEKQGYLTAVLYLAPGDTSKAYGGSEVCPWRTAACSAHCLGTTSGQLALPSGQNAEAWKTLLFTHARGHFRALLAEEIRKHAAKARRAGLTPVVRLNGSSDIPWERVVPDLFTAFSDVQFYDYTKSADRAAAHAAGRLPRNYHLTYSRGETDGPDTVRRLLERGISVAIVGILDAVREWVGRHLPTVDGDETDLRFLDPPGSLIALSPKGNTIKHDETGFVVRLPARTP